MSQPYAQKRIEEALRLAKGNKARAGQIIKGWALEDPQLLLALTKPHLDGILAYNIDRVASGRAEKAIVKKAPKAPRPVEAPKEDPFGKELLKAVADSHSTIFGMDAFEAPRKAGKASQRHVHAIHQMASRSKTKHP